MYVREREKEREIQRESERRGKRTKERNGGILEIVNKQKSV